MSLFNTSSILLHFRGKYNLGKKIPGFVDTTANIDYTRVKMYTTYA